MFQRKPRRFRRRPNGRNNHGHGNGSVQSKMRTNSFSNNQSRNKFRPPLSAEKLLEKYNSLAKEAMSSGDKTLSENYLQHADHYMRIIEDKNKNRISEKANEIEKVEENNKNSTNESTASQESNIKNK